MYFTQVIVPSTYRLFGMIDETMACLPFGAFAFYRRYLFINMNDEIGIFLNQAVG